MAVVARRRRRGRVLPACLLFSGLTGLSFPVGPSLAAAAAVAAWYAKESSLSALPWPKFFSSRRAEPSPTESGRGVARWERRRDFVIKIGFRDVQHLTRNLTLVSHRYSWRVLIRLRPLSSGPRLIGSIVITLITRCS